MAQSFRDKVLQAVADGKRTTEMWSKIITNSTVGRYHHTFLMSGNPSNGTYPGAAKAATAITGGSSPSIAGGIITCPDPVALHDALLTNLKVMAGTASLNGSLILCDLLASYNSFDFNSAAAQPTTITPTTGNLILTRYTNGRGVMILADVQTGLGATPRGYTVTYTDETGATGTTPSHTTIASAAVAQVPYAQVTAGPFMTLAAGDKGVKSIQSLTIAVGGTGAGTVALSLVKPLAVLNAAMFTTTSHIFGELKGLEELTAVEILTGAALTWVWVPANATNATIFGSVDKVDVPQ